jgi:uncharacterized membrane protein
MGEQEKIDQLQKELDQLNSQLQQQQQKIAGLQKIIDGLGPGTAPSKVPRGANFSLENFIGLRLIHFIGIVVLVIGLSIGVKYAIDKELVSEGMRISLAYAAGLVLYFLSVRLKKKYVLFSAILFSGGMASLYFTTYGAYVYYSMLSFALAFAIMIFLTLLTVYEAIRYNRQEIALLGLIGAYAIPFLISKNADRPDLFFIYISLINLGVVFLCVRKSWKNVGRTAQAITWVLFIKWSSMPSHERFSGIGIFFIIFFFLLFFAAVLSFKLAHKNRLTVNDAYQLILNTVAIYISVLFLLGYSADADIAVTTLAISAFTALQAVVFYASWKEEVFVTRMLSSLALTFFALFIYFNWTGFVVTLLWLLTAVIVFACGFRMKSVMARMTAIVLMGATLVKLLAIDSRTFTTVQKLVAYLVLGVLLLVISFFYQKYKQRIFTEDK